MKTARSLASKAASNKCIFDRKPAKTLRPLLYILYLVVLAIMCFYTSKTVYYDMDLAFYTGCILEPEHPGKEDLHAAVYEILERDLPPQNWKRMTDSTNAYRHQVHINALLYHEQLQFYRVKPLYVTILHAFYKAGWSPVKASVWINLICYVLIGIILLVYLLRHLPFNIAYLTSVCVMLWPMVLDGARNNSPDLLFSLLFISGILLMSSQKNQFRIAAIPFVFLMIFVRVESLLFVLAFASICRIFSSGNYSLRYLTVLLGFSCAAALVVSLLYPLSWSLVYRHSLLGYVADLSGRDAAMGIRDYLLAFKSLPRMLFVSDYSLMILLLLFVYLKLKAENTILRVLLYSMCTYLLLRLLLLPDLSIRYYTGTYVLTIILFVRTYFEAASDKQSLLKTS